MTTTVPALPTVPPTDRGAPDLDTAAPGSTSYDDLVRPWNLAVPVQPRLAVRARTAEDVVAAVRHARRHGLTVSAQATGHGAGLTAGADVVVATRGLDECTVTPDGRARVGAGVKWLRVVQEAAAHGLAPLCGSTTDVGVVGYTTGGGVGPMARTHGLASDRVTAFEVVTGDGVLRRATPDDDAELFFALRGGKSALGVVTAVEFDLVAQPRFYGGALWFAAEHAPAVVEAWRTWAADLPVLGTTSIAICKLPPLPGVPRPLAGRTTVSVRVLWTGDEAGGAAAVAPLRAAAPVLLDGVRELPFAALDSVHNDPVDPLPAADAAAPLTALPADAAAALLDVALDGGGHTVVEVRQLGGAVSRPRRGDSAYGSRDVPYHLFCVGIAGTPGLQEDTRRLREALAPWIGGRPLPNYAFSPAQLPECFDAPTLARLRNAIHRYDPDGVLALGRALTA